MVSSVLLDKLNRKYDVVSEVVCGVGEINIPTRDEWVDKTLPNFISEYCYSRNDVFNTTLSFKNGKCVGGKGMSKVSIELL